MKHVGESTSHNQGAGPRSCDPRGGGGAHPGGGSSLAACKCNGNHVLHWPWPMGLARPCKNFGLWHVCFLKPEVLRTAAIAALQGLLRPLPRSVPQPQFLPRGSGSHILFVYLPALSAALAQQSPEKMRLHTTPKRPPTSSDAHY